MSDSPATAAALLRIEERLRQERETFDQRKEQEAKWFSLRLLMGYIAALTLPGVGVVAGYILINSNLFGDAVVTSAGAALFVDVLGLIAAVWKVVLNTGSVTRLEPIITDEPSILDRPREEGSEASLEETR
eukprot:NODE_6589_length_630_cov_7.045726_g6566_i0.p1 GENE.NODE_6589_length_630_cov_7.045726_g6566_i0~~NODE_6589_length_630_cov_7.045726_g6566_i0.p1  ORF type:complete len:131 (-),score=5.39 NODE_6589_length_630_cov_7.045726_g6566_i0:119-511(-)